MRIAVVQPLSDLSNAIKLIIEAINHGSNVIFLPEKWMDNGISAINEVMGISSSFDGVIIPGAFELDGEVKAPIIIKGQIIDWAHKSHLTETESTRLYPGPGPLLLNYRGAKLGIMICYDADFPEIARILALNGASLFLVPSKIVNRGINMWRTYILARSLENRIPLLNANALIPPLFLGGSRAIDLREEDGIIVPMEQVLGSAPGVIYYDYDGSMKPYREKRMRELRDYRVNEIAI
ncbi:MAG: carbon-nitrogen hydrolase family protein [Thermocladium sp.]|jgi:predicted amidohydrolase